MAYMGVLEVSKQSAYKGLEDRVEQRDTSPVHLSILLTGNCIGAKFPYPTPEASPEVNCITFTKGRLPGNYNG